MLGAGFNLPIEGQPTRASGPATPSDSCQYPHAGGKNGDKKSRVLATYIVEKGKPLASPA